MSYLEPFPHAGGMALPPIEYADRKDEPGAGALIAGAVFPAAVILLELVSGLCANLFFDPLPSVGHLLLVATVPAVNFALWHAARRERAAPRLEIAAGAAIAISLAYVILFLPILPFAVIGILVGLGILPFAPLFALNASVRWSGRLHPADDHRWRRIGLGAGLGVLALLLVDLPAAATHLALKWERTPADRPRAVGLMRSLGDPDLLLKLCYGADERTGGLVTTLFFTGPAGLWNDRVSGDQEAARRLYFRVTGTAFNAEPHPVAARGTRSWLFDWDADQGGEAVGGQVRGLSLAGSRIDGSVAGNDNLGYFEWTADVANAADRQHEARLTLALPEGAVVSRATLWVNGEPREASVAGRAETRAAYRSVTQARRDPLLVTTAGAGRVLVQAFPIAPAGTIRFRIGYSAPFAIGRDGRRSLALPAIVERNFEVKPEQRHDVWIEGSGPLASADASLRADAAPGGTTLRGSLDDGFLLDRRPRITLPRLTAPTASTTTVAGAGKVPAITVTQRIGIAEAARTPFTILLDGSSGNRKGAEALKAALDAIPNGLPVGLVIAEDEPVAVPAAPWSAVQRRSFLRAIAAAPFDGGEDNVAALERAIGTGAPALVWVHGPQPVDFPDSTLPLQQTLDRSRRLPQLVRYQPEPGRAFTLAGERWFDTARQVSPSADPTADLRALLADFDGGRRWQVTQAVGWGAGRPGSQHIARLWAARRIEQLQEAGGSGRGEQVALAHRLNLVTPVSGAVVLETDADYQANGLPVPTAEDVPAVPEPETWMLLIIGFGVTGWAMRRQRRLALAR